MKLLSLIKFLGCQPFRVVPTADESLLTTCYTRNATLSAKPTPQLAVSQVPKLRIFIKSKNKCAKSSISKRINKHDLKHKMNTSHYQRSKKFQTQARHCNQSYTGKIHRRVRFNLNTTTSLTEMTNSTRFDTNHHPLRVNANKNELELVQHQQHYHHPRRHHINTSITSRTLRPFQPSRIRKQNVYVKQSNKPLPSVIIVNT